MLSKTSTNNGVMAAAAVAVLDKDKERKYVEKVKALKTENKKLKTLLKDSEKLFY
jgi:hypothetical protein